MSLLDEIQRVERDAERLLSQSQVEAALDRMALAIEAALGERLPVVLTVLNGGVIFAGQLLTRLRFPLELDSINASRYRGATSGGEIHWLLKPALSLQGRTVLILDDVLDEGITLATLIDWCREQGAAAVYTAVLIDKQLGRERPCRADFVGLEAENRYLFGYGMDYKGYLRNAPGIYAVKGL
jgi:hypoxanthine phosphoribosyltransferase